MTPRGVLVDAAGCLIHPREPVGATYARAARRQGVDLPAWRVDDAFRRVVARAEPMVFPDVPPAARPERERAWWRGVVRSTFLAVDSTVRFPDAEALFAGLFEHFAGGGAWSLAPGARQALATLRADGLALGVASNFDHRLPDILEELEMAILFDSITIPSTCGFAKPDPAFFRAATSALGTAPGETLHLGNDPERDVAAARAAGLAALQWPGGSPEDPKDWRALPARIRAAATLERRPAPPAPHSGDEPTS
ncbi:MAG: HAD-IA family hydrolase [Myxococcota bacterium]